MKAVLHLITILTLLVPASVRAQQQVSANNQQRAQVFGIYIDADGQLTRQPRQESSELMRLQTLTRRGRQEQRPTFISLRQTMDAARAVTGSNQPLPEATRYLGGLTRIQYLIVDPVQHDILLGGPAEPWDATNPLEPLGKLTGRPVLQFDDLVLAFRNGIARRPAPFGCSIDPAPNAVEKGLEAVRENPGARPAQLALAVAEKLGPQPVRFFGVPPETRTAFICVAADYKLKHYTLGLETIPVPGAGIPVDATRPAGNGFWFEASYKPLLVSEDGNVFEIQGPRLCLKAGAIPFDTRGATPRAIAWAKVVSEHMDRLASAMPVFAELQNFADLSLVSNLIRRDRLQEKAGLDLGWLLDGSAWQPARVPTPHTAQVLTNVTHGSLVAGGVKLSTYPYTDPEQRIVDHTSRLKDIRNR